MVQISHSYLTFAIRVMSLLFSTVSRFVIAFIPRSKCLLISWLQSPSVVILELKKINKVCHFFIISQSICHTVIGLDAMIWAFWMLSFRPAFPFSSFTFVKRLFTSSSLSAIRVVSPAYLKLLVFLPAILIPVWDLSSLGYCMMFSVYVN